MPIPYKTWVHNEAGRIGLTPAKVYQMVIDGLYPSLRTQGRGNNGSYNRVVLNPNVTLAKKYLPRPGEMRLKEFVLQETERTGMNPHAIETRILRGQYPGLKRRRVTHSRVFVRF